MEEQDTIFIGIAGGTASGKSTVVKKIMKKLVNRKLIQIDLDSYYKDFSALSPEERNRINFDHPRAIDFPLLIKHVEELKNGNPIEKPVYDFTTHLRTKETTTIYPTKIIILEGILIFTNKRIRELLDLKIFVDTASDIRLMRRIERDIKERGRTLDSVKNQYFETVRPMHIQFIEPTKQFADIIIPSGGKNKAAINMIISGIKDLLGDS